MRIESKLLFNLTNHLPCLVSDFRATSLWIVIPLFSSLSRGMGVGLRVASTPMLNTQNTPSHLPIDEFFQSLKFLFVHVSDRWKPDVDSKIGWGWGWERERHPHPFFKIALPLYGGDNDDLTPSLNGYEWHGESSLWLWMPISVLRFLSCEVEGVDVSRKSVTFLEHNRLISTHK